MRGLKDLSKDIARIYRQNRTDAYQYLHKARRLRENYGASLPIVYCWFYSTPLKWTIVEQKVFKLHADTHSFDLQSVTNMSAKEMLSLLKPMPFSRRTSIQLISFCNFVKDTYASWESFADAVKNEDIFSLFRISRFHSNTRLTFKNLSAMKSFVGSSNNLLILDTHVSRILGLNLYQRTSYVTEEKRFRDLLKYADEITQRMREDGLDNVTTIEWSLSIWFNKAKIHADRLLTEIQDS